MSRPAPPVPQTGGSFVLGKGNRLEQRERTIGPLEPEHAANRPPPAPPEEKRDGA